MTQSQLTVRLNNFTKKYNGKAVDFDHVYGAQCVDEIKLYLHEVFGSPVFIGNAKDYWEKFGGSLAKLFTKVANDLHDVNQIPPAGAITVWKGSLPGSGGYGHVSIVISSSKSGFWSIDQNWNGKYIHKVFHRYDKNFYGWLTYKTDKAPAPAPSAQKVVYTVRKGDFLSRIAGKYHTTLSKILKLNPSIKNPNLIYPSQKIRVK